MHPPAVMSEFNLVLIVVLMVIGGGVLGWILCIIHAAHKHIPEEERTPWMVFFGLLTLCLVITTPADIQPQLSPADKMLAARTTPPLTIHQLLDQCPPEAPGLTAEVIFTVESRADAEPAVTGCTRIAEQQYLVKGKR